MIPVGDVYFSDMVIIPMVDIKFFCEIKTINESSWDSTLLIEICCLISVDSLQFDDNREV